VIIRSGGHVHPIGRISLIIRERMIPICGSETLEQIIYPVFCSVQETRLTRVHVLLKNNGRIIDMGFQGYQVSKEKGARHRRKVAPRTEK
jgi:hypothetical protein